MQTVRAPATSANLGSGFDVFGVALGRPADVIRVDRASATSIEVTGVGARYIPTDPEKNVVGAVAEALDARTSGSTRACAPPRGWARRRPVRRVPR
jgi:homoserine kinase (EC 2.7.1.39)